MPMILAINRDFSGVLQTSFLLYKLRSIYVSPMICVRFLFLFFKRRKLNKIHRLGLQDYPQAQLKYDEPNYMPFNWGL